VSLVGWFLQIVEGIGVSSRLVPTNKKRVLVSLVCQFLQIEEGIDISSRLVSKNIVTIGWCLQIYKKEFLWFSLERC
jgi:hypothetical protein